MKLFKIKMWVIDLEKPEYERFEVQPISIDIVLDSFLSKKYVKKVLAEQFKKIIDKWEEEHGKKEN